MQGILGLGQQFLPTRFGHSLRGLARLLLKFHLNLNASLEVIAQRTAQFFQPLLVDQHLMPGADAQRPDAFLTADQHRITSDIAHRAIHVQAQQQGGPPGGHFRLIGRLRQWRQVFGFRGRLSVWLRVTLRLGCHRRCSLGSRLWLIRFYLGQGRRR